MAECYYFASLEMSPKASNTIINQSSQQQQMTSTNQEQDYFQYAHTSAHNKQQSRKHCSSDNDIGRSHCQEPAQGIMRAATAMASTKSRIRLFSQHTSKRPQQPTSTMVPEDLTAKNQHKA